jgi:hypothetical protein
VHGAIYKERGLLTAGGKEIKNKEEILHLLEAIWEPSQVAVLHCRGHQKGMDYVSRGNHLADHVAKRSAEELISKMPKQTAKLLLAPELPPNPNYAKEEEQWAKDEKGIKENGGWWKLPDQRLCPQCCNSPSGKTTARANALGENGPGKTTEQILLHFQAPHPVRSSEC